MRLKHFAFAVLAACSLFISSPARSACEKLDPYPVDVFFGYYSYIPWLAKEKGFYEEACLDVTFEQIDGIANKIIAFSSGQLKAMVGAEVALDEDQATRRANGQDGVAVYRYAFANRTPWAVVGKSNNPRDMLGSVTLTSRCTWSGDITTPRSDPPKGTLANPTEPLRAYLAEVAPEARIFCLETPYKGPKDDPEYATKGKQTFYLKGVPGSKGRRDALGLGEADFVLLVYDIAIVTMRSDRLPDGSEVLMTVAPGVMPEIPAALLTVVKGQDEELHERFIKASQKAVDYLLANREAEIDRLTTLVADPNQKTPFSVLNVREASDEAARLTEIRSRLTEVFRYGIEGGVWSLSGCIAREPMRNYAAIMGLKGSVEDIVDPRAWCN
jgi:hypothetical protein